jgi:mannitol 2-dehydrogenase
VLSILTILKLYTILKNDDAPITIFGYLTQALKLRKENNTGSVTILSCDNIQENGHMTKKMLLSYVAFAEPDLLDWINANVSFPNSMVIELPATIPTDIAELKEVSGIEDQWPVVCESFNNGLSRMNLLQDDQTWSLLEFNL